MGIEKILTDNPYCLTACEKHKLFTPILGELTLFHQQRCLPYKRILEALPISLSSFPCLEDIPMLPVRLFKLCELKSIPKESIEKIYTSSRTTSQLPSQIFMDKETLEIQAKASKSIIKSFIGEEHPPMIFVDRAGISEDNTISNSRSTGIRRFKQLSKEHLFILDDEMNIEWGKLEAFLQKNEGQRIIIFGFTFMVWQYLYLTLVERKVRLDLKNSILFHTGGWKKLKDLAVENATFNLRLKEQLGVDKIFNFYGMVELLGVIFMECEQGYFHAPDFADIIIRHPNSLKPLSYGNKGVIQVLTPLARSFPGHSLLTEDLGEIIGEDDCACGRKGKYFKVYGRLPTAELRGCSDTYAYECFIEEKANASSFAPS